MGIAQTGTGKTAAFVLPLLTRLLADEYRAGPRRCRALILAPTRELAAQIDESITTYAANTNLKSTVIVGGVKPRPQIKAMERGVDILVATPGRLLDHVGTGAIVLDKVRTIVLDEADQMMDLGFLPSIRRIMEKLKASRQTLLFSATMPKQIRALANDFLDKPVEISVAPQSKPVERIDQRVVLVPRSEKRNALRDVLAVPGMERAIVFARTKRGADRVAENLMKDGLEAFAIHGNKSQNQRVRALDGFKSGKVKILVATDIAARGIDVDGVSHVVNYDLPNQAENYVHRIGRTARAGRDGIAISIVEPLDHDLLAEIEKITRLKLTPEGETLDVRAAAKARKDTARDQQQKRQARSQNKRRRNKPSGQGGAQAGGQGGQKKRRPQRRRKPAASAG